MQPCSNVTDIKYPVPRSLYTNAEEKLIEMYTLERYTGMHFYSKVKLLLCCHPFKCWQCSFIPEVFYFEVSSKTRVLNPKHKISEAKQVKW